MFAIHYGVTFSVSSDKFLNLTKEYSKLETNAREIERGHAHDEAMVLWL